MITNTDEYVTMQNIQKPPIPSLDEQCPDPQQEIVKLQAEIAGLQADSNMINAKLFEKEETVYKLTSLMIHHQIQLSNYDIREVQHKFVLNKINDQVESLRACMSACDEEKRDCEVMNWAELCTIIRDPEQDPEYIAELGGYWKECTNAIKTSHQRELADSVNALEFLGNADSQSQKIISQASQIDVGKSLEQLLKDETVFRVHNELDEKTKDVLRQLHDYTREFALNNPTAFQEHCQLNSIKLSQINITMLEAMQIVMKVKVPQAVDPNASQIDTASQIKQ